MIQLVSHRYGAEGVGLSMQGGRAENQDDMGCVETPLGFLVVVCDGMGGGPGGKTASYISKSVVLGEFEKCSELASPYDVIKMAIDKANSAIEDHVRMVPELNGMGSTIVMILINEKSAIVAHLGDSRCYQIRKGKVIFRTKDHSLVGELVNNGAFTEEQARTSPQSNIITRGLGSTTNHVAEIEEISYQHGDRFVLCTDGVWGIMSHQDLELRFANKQDIASLVRNLSAEIDQIGFSQGNHHDNYTIALLEMEIDSFANTRKDKKEKFLLLLCTALLAISVVFNVVCFLNMGANPQMEMLKIRNDSLMDVNIQLGETLEDSHEEIGRLTTLNEELEKTILLGNDVSKHERARLLHCIDSLGSKIDSLRKTINRLQVDDRNKAKKIDNGRKGIPENISTVKLLDACINNLRNICKMKTLRQKDATTKVKKCVGDCIALLEQFNKATNNKYENKINPILKKLKTEETFDETKNVQSSKVKGPHITYELQKKTKKEINLVVQELRELKEGINKN